MGIQTVYASAARTATPTAVVINTRRASGLYIVIDATAITASPSVVPTIDLVDSVSGKFVNLVTAAAVATVSTVMLRIGRGLTAAANATVLEFLPDQVRVTMTHGDADSITYSVSAHLLD